MSAEVKTIIEQCEKLFNLKEAALPPEYDYRSLPFCVIDAVFSIGVKDESVRNTVERYARELGLVTYRTTLKRKGLPRCCAVSRAIPNSPFDARAVSRNNGDKRQGG